MFGLLFHFLKAKIVLLGTANIPVIATLLVLGSTGLLVTGTIEANGDEDDRRSLNLVITPLESKTCLEALIAQTETLLELDALAADATAQLRHLRDGARERAADQHKVIDETALRAQFATAAARISPALSAARKQVLDAADLTKCQDGDPATGVAVNVESLRAAYDAILVSFGQTLSGILSDAQTAFDRLVATAQPKTKKHEKDDDDEDDDD